MKISINSFQDFLDITKNHKPSLEKPLMCLSFHSLCSLGMGVAWGYLELLQKEYPDWVPYFSVDCGDCPGYALSALRHGIKNIFYKGPHWDRLQGAALSYDASILSMDF